MLPLVTAIFGFLAPFLPSVVKIFQAKQDNAHELAMMKLRLEGDKADHLYKMEEINLAADIAEQIQIHKPVASFGIQVLDAAKNSGWSSWMIAPPFYLFVLVDFLSGLVRPLITYTAFSGYLIYKWAIFNELTSYLYSGDAAGAIRELWREEDWAVLTLVLSYYFGLRSYKAVFGGSAKSDRAQ